VVGAGFKSAYAPVEGEATKEDTKLEENVKKESSLRIVDQGLEAESDTEDEGYEVYNPRIPTEWKTGDLWQITTH
jgi:hypothetical protein